jgi:hypothetical protein
MKLFDEGYSRHDLPPRSSKTLKFEAIGLHLRGNVRSLLFFSNNFLGIVEPISDIFPFHEHGVVRPGSLCDSKGYVTDAEIEDLLILRGISLAGKDMLQYERKYRYLMNGHFNPAFS